MISKSSKKSTFFGALIAAATLATSCQDLNGPNVTPTDTQCQVNQAQIAVRDGAFQNLCGCGGTAGSFTYVPGTLTCNISVGTTVFFQFLGTVNRHQIISTGGLAFASTPISDPAQGATGILSTAVQFTTAGTADFEDAFTSQLQGQIIVSP